MLYLLINTSITIQIVRNIFKITVCDVGIDLQRYGNIYGDRGRIRTLNPQSRNLIFYPVELRGQIDCKSTKILMFELKISMSK